MTTARALDQFYTKPDVALQCLGLLKKKIGDTLFNKAFFLEPSAGAGAFYCALPDGRRHGLDKQPSACMTGVIEAMDFFDFDIQKLRAQYSLAPDCPIVTVGNPPFGKNSSLALKFLNAAAEFSTVVAFILPSTFRKDSMVNKVHRHFHLAAEGDIQLAKNSFEFQGNDYDVPCVFQVWVKKDHQRELVVKTMTHPDFSFVRKEEDHDFAIRRVGGLAGKVILPSTPGYSDYSPASHYYIKAAKGALKRCLSTLQAINWDSVKYNTAGNPSVSKRELVALYATELVETASLKEAA